MTASAPVLIAGGGIAGLALAIALARRGIPATVLERREEFSTEGAGIQLGPNATGALSRLGVEAFLQRHVGEPECLRVRSAVTGHHLAELPLGAWIARRHGSPYWSAHRADLQSALLEAARTLPQIELVTGTEVTSFAVSRDRVEVSAGGEMRQGRMLAGADGQWSATRSRLWPEARISYSGKSATRTVIPAERAPEPLRAPHVGAWLAPFGHVVHYPVRKGREIAVVVILDEPWPGEGWSIEVEPDALEATFARFAAPLRALLSAAKQWRRWALYDAPPFPRWSAGPVTLVGDAAHPVLPFLAQGGALAIEDAETLAQCIAAGPDMTQACRRYAGMRQPRAARVQAASRRNGQIYRATGPAGFARDLALLGLPGRIVIAAYDWVYGWKGDALSAR